MHHVCRVHVDQDQDDRADGQELLQVQRLGWSLYVHERSRGRGTTQGPTRPLRRHTVDVQTQRRRRFPAAHLHRTESASKVREFVLMVLNILLINRTSLVPS